MVERISVMLTDQIISNKLIPDNMREWYIYAFCRLFETFISLGMLMIVGVGTNRLLPLILFWVFFDLLRRRAGGYHCEKYWQCFITTTIVFIGVVKIEPFLSSHPIILYSLLVVASLVILIVGTINHPNIDYDSMELVKSKEFSRHILAIELFVILSFFMLGVKEFYLTYMSVGVIICAILMGLAKLLGQEVKVNEKAE